MKPFSGADVLKFGAVSCAGICVGKALYMHLVDIPSKIDLDPQFLLLSSKDSFSRARDIELGVLGAVCGCGAFFFENKSNRCVLYVLAAAVHLSTSAWGFRKLFPANKNLCEMDFIDTSEKKKIQDCIRKWNNLHFWKMPLYIASLVGFSFALWVHG